MRQSLMRDSKGWVRSWCGVPGGNTPRSCPWKVKSKPGDIKQETLKKAKTIKGLESREPKKQLTSLVRSVITETTDGQRKILQNS